VLTPPDLISQILLMVPLSLLYGVSIAVAYVARPRKTQ
jgi:Sec-independent protein secretion pathway component TatC